MSKVWQALKVVKISYNSEMQVSKKYQKEPFNAF